MGVSKRDVIKVHMCLENGEGLTRALVLYRIVAAAGGGGQQCE